MNTCVAHLVAVPVRGIAALIGWFKLTIGADTSDSK